MPANLEKSAVATNRKGQVSFQFQRKNAKHCSNSAQLHLSHTLAKFSKFSRPGFNSTWTMNFQMFKLVLEKAEEPEIKLPASGGSLKMQEFQKNIYFFLFDYDKAYDCVDHNKLWKILQDMGITDHLTCLLRDLYAGQEATVRSGQGTTDWFQIRKAVHQDSILSPCFFAKYITWNAGLDEAQAGIKIARRNINDVRYTDHTTVVAESKELKSLLMKVSERRKWKCWLKTQHSEK